MENQSTDGTDRGSQAKIPHKLQSTLKLTEPPPTLGDWSGTTSQLLKTGGGAALWGAAYIALTGALLVAGALGTVYAATAIPPGPAGLVVIFTLGIGSMAASPTVAGLVLIRVHQGLRSSSPTRDDEAAERSPHAIAQHSERGLR